MANTRKNLRYALSGLHQQFRVRRSIWDICKTLSLVIPLTLLIWVYAERAERATGSISVLIDVSIADPFTASVIDRANSPIEITMEGPRSQFDALKTDLEQRSMDRRLILTLPPSYAQVGEQSVNLLQLLNSDPKIRDSRVTIDSVSPPQIQVSVQRLVSHPFDVAPPSLSQVTFQKVSFDPPQVTVRGPQKTVDSLRNSEKSLIYVDLSNVDLNVPGPTTVEVPIIKPADSHVTVSPSKVKMTFEIGSREIDYTLPSVAIVIERPIATEGSFRVSPKRPLVYNVKIHGPIDQINKFRGDSPTAQIVAVLPVSQDDAGKTDISHDVYFEDVQPGKGLPPGVTVVGGPYSVEFDAPAIGSANSSRER